MDFTQSLNLVVGVLTLIRRHVLEPTAKTQSLWRASPFAVALLAVVILPWLPTPRTLASTTMVSDEVMARARAYGTPIVSLALSPVTPTPTRRRRRDAALLAASGCAPS